jgi:hypothetical protein
LGDGLKDPVPVEDEHKVGATLTEDVVDRDIEMVPEVQSEGRLEVVGKGEM